MGTDFIRLFDKRRCDQMLRMTHSELAELVEAPIHVFNEFDEIRQGFPEDVAVLERLSHLADRGLDYEIVKAELIERFCISEETILIDYWGCYAEVFKGCDPEGSISDLLLFPHIKESRFLLLTAANVQQMLDSLQQHHAEAIIITDDSIGKLRDWRHFCSGDQGFMVAYFFDY